jgi:hypothetical protein
MPAFSNLSVQVRWQWAAVLLFVLKAAHAGDAGPLLEPGWLSGSLRATYWSGSQRLDDRHDLSVGALWLKAEPRSGAFSALAQGWVRNDELDHSAPPRTLMREAFVQYSEGSLTMRFGRQLIVWGRADQINPTDNLSPRDFTLPVPESSDERFGTLALSASQRLGDYSVSAVWLPRFRPNIVPFPPGLNVNEVSPDSARQVGIKLDHSAASGIDWSASWYSGFDLNPNLRMGSLVPGRLDAVHPRNNVAGLDFAVPVGEFGIRGEAAYTWIDDAPEAGPLAKKPFFFGVLGVERTFAGTLNINLQAFAYRVTGYSDPRAVSDPILRQFAVSQAISAHQLERWERGLTLRVADKWWNETLEGELVLVSTLGRRSLAVRPRLTYAIDDHLRVTVGADVYRGSDEGFFGQLQRNSASFVEVKFSW